MFADIVSGNTSAADTFFIIAAILFGIVALTHLFGFSGPRDGARGGPYWAAPVGGLFMAAGLCLTAIGLLCL
jgi:hypothetical protein